jgi:murein DD-endopeptidase MepM/ murein hydrolase activator NlpD
LASSARLAHDRRAPKLIPPDKPTPEAAPDPLDAPARAAPAAPVEQRSLQPLSPAPAAQPADQPAPSPARAAPPPAAPIATYRTVVTRTVTGRVVEVEGGARTYRVRKGDTLEEIADRLGTTVRALREDNGLSRRESIHPGDVLKGPRSTASAYVTGAGDTLYSIARRFSVSPEAIRSENGLSANASLRPGQKLRLPDGFRDHGPLTTSSRVRVDAGQAAEPEPRDEAPSAPYPSSPPPRAAAPRSAPSQAAPSFRTVTTRTVTGRVVEVEGPAVRYTVRKGDNLEKIARKLDTSIDQLRDDNDIGRREKIQPGDVLKGPRTTARAYVAGSGDTLFSIARRFGVTADALREENDLGRNAGLRPGQKIRLPDGYRDHGPLTVTTRVPVAPAPEAFEPAPVQPEPQPQPAPAPRPEPPRAPTPSPAPTPAPAPTPFPYQPRPVPRAQPPAPRPAPPTARIPSRVAPAPSTPPPPAYAPQSAPPASDAQVSELGRGRFVWPLQGDIVSDFGPKPNGQRNDGINISAQVGSSVRAAAAGDVVYAGDQVPGFGNLVLVKHANGWVTAYGHLSRVQVKMQQKVAQGQEIGLAGATGGVAAPQLHFEIRYAASPLERAKPIDPKLVLPR